MRSAPARGRGGAIAAAAPDPDRAYVRYTLDFFRRWVPYYDLFARSIFWAYNTLANRIDPQPGMKVLDLCTGTGEVGLRCARSGATVVGVDLSPDMLRRARRKASDRRQPLEICRGDARALPFPDGSFEVVALTFALHDMPRRVRREVLREAARLASERLVILDYDLPRWPLARRFTRWMINLFESPFFTSFVADDPVALLAEAGLPAPRILRDWTRLFSTFEVSLADPGSGET